MFMDNSNVPNSPAAHTGDTLRSVGWPGLGLAFLAVVGLWALRSPMKKLWRQRVQPKLKGRDVSVTILTHPAPEIFQTPRGQAVFRAFDAAARAGQAEEATAILREALEDPALTGDDRQNIELMLAQRLVAREEFHEGFRLLNRLLAEQRDDRQRVGIIRTALGDAHFRRGLKGAPDVEDLQTALSHLRQAVEFVDDHPTLARIYELFALVHTALAVTDAQRFDEAYRNLLQAHRMGLRRPEAFGSLALALHAVFSRRPQVTDDDIQPLSQWLWTLKQLKGLRLEPHQERELSERHYRDLARMLMELKLFGPAKEATELGLLRFRDSQSLRDQWAELERREREGRMRVVAWPSLLGSSAFVVLSMLPAWPAWALGVAAVGLAILAGVTVFRAVTVWLGNRVRTVAGQLGLSRFLRAFVHLRTFQDLHKHSDLEQAVFERIHPVLRAQIRRDNSQPGQDIEPLFEP
ncbi:MAG TPA: hypothetical protein VJB16_00280, partial [archaeon]|nr:hypothetical protein [archaeon]